MKRIYLPVFLLLGVVLSLLPAKPVSAGHQYLWWDDVGDKTFTSLGANSHIIIRSGQMEFVNLCGEGGTNDFLNPGTDAYIVPSGSVSVGSALEDVSGEPNTIISPSAHGTIIDETIGITAPSGTVGEGKYAVVYDECQDGKVDPGDFVLDPAFEVGPIPADVPALPSIAVEKALAGVAGQELEDLHEWLDDWFKAQAALDPNPLNRMLYGMGTTPITAHPAHIVLIQVANQAKHYRGIEADPPDPEFQQLSPLLARETIDLQSNDPLLLAMEGVGTESSSEGALAEALLRSLERYQGADQQGNGTWALVHARAIRDNSLQLRAQLAKSSNALDGLDDALAADTTPLDANAASVQEFISRVRTSGFIKDEVREARNLGLTDAEIEQLETDVAALDLSTFSKANLRGAIGDLRTNNDSLVAELGVLATDMQSNIATLKADPLVSNKTPKASAGGPYSGSEGTAITFDGTGSTSPSPSPITKYEWDLDGDGAFDDATGATPTKTYNHAFEGLVGLRVTNSDDLQNVAYARVDVADVNRPPNIDSLSPTRRSGLVVAGNSSSYSVSASDPDGDGINVTWYLDGAAAGTGKSFTYSPDSTAMGGHRIEAVVSDDSPLGGSVVEEWLVTVVEADADGDGWRANVDCDDSQPARNPGRVEIAGNGIDDDCDDATSDALSDPRGGNVNPKATFLHADRHDRPELPNVIDLTAAEFIPGDTLRFSYNVAPPGFSFACGLFGYVDASRFYLRGVFSGSNSLLAPEEPARVPDAIGAGVNHPSSPTYHLSEPTDIPEDFVISPYTASVIEVPPGAKYLLIGVNDVLWYDNCGEITLTIDRLRGAPSAGQPPVADDQAVNVDEDAGVNLVLAASDADNDALTYTVVTQPQHGTLTGTAPSLKYTPDANYSGPDSFTFKANDGEADSNVATARITVKAVNDKPEAKDDSAEVVEDEVLTLSQADLLANDADAENTGAQLSVTAVSNAAHGQVKLLEGGEIRFTPAADYSGIAGFDYTLSDGGLTDTGHVAVTVTPVNDAPEVVAGPDRSADENSTVEVGATFTDVEAAEQTYECSVSWGDGTTSQGTVINPSGDTPGSCEATHPYLDDDPSGTASDEYDVKVTVTDSGAPKESGTAGLKATIANLAPSIAGVAGPADPVLLGTEVSVKTTFTDAGSLDTHECVYSWGDGTDPTSASAEGEGDGDCGASHTYASPGVYPVAVKVTDDDTGSATAKYEYVVVYDPEGGFVTGGGWIESPEGAYRADPTLTGRANFGFVSKYKTGATVPTGSTEFQFHAAKMNFHSSEYEWLVVAGARAQYKGVGTVNGTGSYGFLLTAIDGQLSGGGGADKFRIKIWDRTTGAVVYDNQMDAEDTANPTTVIKGGSIVIHK